MDSINSWVDPDEVKRIAESLMADVEQEGDFEEEHASSEGSATTSQVRSESKNLVRLSAEKSLAEASKLAAASGMLSGDKVAVKVDAEPTVQSRDDRHRQQVAANGVLEKLEQWLREETEAMEVCMVDRDGDVLLSTMENDSWSNLVISSAAMAENPEGGSIRLKVSGGCYLQLVPAATVRGGILIGMLLGNPVAQDEAFKLAKKSGEIANS